MIDPVRCGVEGHALWYCVGLPTGAEAIPQHRRMSSGAGVETGQRAGSMTLTASPEIPEKDSDVVDQVLIGLFNDVRRGGS